MHKSLYYDAREGAGIPVLKVVLTLMLVLALLGGCACGIVTLSKWCADNPNVFATE